MKNVLIWIGSVVCSLIAIAIPILLPISIIFKWIPVVTLMLGIFTVSEFALLVVNIAMDAIENGY